VIEYQEEEAAIRMNYFNEKNSLRIAASSSYATKNNLSS
jgi:hypothetical protein